MRQRRHAHSQHRRSGAALVEFALLLPLLLSLVIGLLEIGQALKSANIMASAVREGGRLAAMDWNDFVPEGWTPNQKVISDVRNLLDAAGLPGECATIELVSAEESDAGEEFDLTDPDNTYRLFRISIRIPYDDISSFPSTIMHGQTLTASLTFRAVRSHGG
jgi:hypothetical protein